MLRLRFSTNKEFRRGFRFPDCLGFEDKGVRPLTTVAAAGEIWRCGNG
jgi:hypothetical protein